MVPELFFTSKIENCAILGALKSHHLGSLVFFLVDIFPGNEFLSGDISCFSLQKSHKGPC